MHVEDAIQKSRKFGAFCAGLVILGCIHTGANLHGGNPTIFGPVAEPHPAWGWVVGLSAIVLAPFTYNVLAFLSLLVMRPFIKKTPDRDVFGEPF